MTAVKNKKVPSPKRPLRIGLTGGIGAGKSSVLELLEKKDVPVLQADRLGHDLLRERAVLREIKKYFGAGVFDEKGGVDRGKLGLEIFADPRKKKFLDGLLHPLVRRRTAQWVARQSKRKPRPPFVVVEVPLLFENGFHRWFDRALSVSAPGRVRRRRLRARGWSQGEIGRREASQWPQKRKNQKADWVLFNSGTKGKLRYTVQRWLGQVRKLIQPGPKF